MCVMYIHVHSVVCASMLVTGLLQFTSAVSLAMHGVITIVGEQKAYLYNYTLTLELHTSSNTYPRIIVKGIDLSTSSHAYIYTMDCQCINWLSACIN